MKYLCRYCVSRTDRASMFIIYTALVRWMNLFQSMIKIVLCSSALYVKIQDLAERQKNECVPNAIKFVESVHNRMNRNIWSKFWWQIAKLPSKKFFNIEIFLQSILIFNSKFYILFVIWSPRNYETFKNHISS